MNSPTVAIRVAGIVLGLLALAQLMRLFIQPEVLVAGHLLPLWPSMIAFLILGGLCVWMWKLTQRSTG